MDVPEEGVELRQNVVESDKLLGIIIHFLIAKTFTSANHSPRSCAAPKSNNDVSGREATLCGLIMFHHNGYNT
jgi:hypothetical protein